jgi:3',5'-cyclic AMP phosphodiesterase CpdA
VAEGGDVANRQEDSEAGPIQPSATSWAQFREQYIERMTARTASGKRTPVYVVPGNHDVSNAVGFYKPMRPLVDKTALVEIYNSMMSPSRPRTSATFDPVRDRVLYSHTVNGVHFVFISVWPDSNARAWLENDLRSVNRSTPVMLFTHDQPEAQARHFINPNGAHDINATDRFENLLADRLADGATIESPTIVEQREFERVLSRHRNVAAYFHGNSNWNEFYDWTGPLHLVKLPTFRVDSPMKGAVSADDETRLSFHVATIDMEAQAMTVRECLWNVTPSSPALQWGESRTISMRR